MPLVATQVNANGPVHNASGTRTGTRTAANFTISLGFEPQYVRVVNVTDRVTGEWHGVAGSDVLTVAAGTRTAAATGIAVSGTTVTVTVATAGLETDNDVVVWEARG